MGEFKNVYCGRNILFDILFERPIGIPNFGLPERVEREGRFIIFKMIRKNNCNIAVTYFITH